MPPSQIPYTGSGVFTLNGSTFGAEVRTDFLSGFDALIYGPAGPGTNAPALFTLQPRGGVVPNPPFPGYSRWVGTNTISNEQISDLVAGRWYVEVLNLSSPGRAMRGQIILVSEPRIGFLVFLGTCALGLAMGLKRQQVDLAASRPNKTARSGPTHLLRVVALILSILVLAVPAFAFSNQPPSMVVPERKVLTNGPPIIFRDKSIRPAIPGASGVPVLGPSPEEVVNWQPVFTNVVSFWYTNAFGSNSSQRFYRAITNL